jgi:hypothetical protein
MGSCTQLSEDWWATSVDAPARTRGVIIAAGEREGCKSVSRWKLMAQVKVPAYGITQEAHLSVALATCTGCNTPVAFRIEFLSSRKHNILYSGSLCFAQGPDAISHLKNKLQRPPPTRERCSRCKNYITLSRNATISWQPAASDFLSVYI